MWGQTARSCAKKLLNVCRKINGVGFTQTLRRHSEPITLLRIMNVDEDGR